MVWAFIPAIPNRIGRPPCSPARKSIATWPSTGPAYHSSSYDYNLTAQLITDGIKETAMPRRIAVTTSQQGLLKKNERERILDNNWVTTVDLRGRSVWLQIEIAGGPAAPAIDSLQVDGSVHAQEPDNQQVTCTVSGSDDGKTWQPLGQAAQVVHPTGELHHKVAFRAPSRSRFYRVAFDNGRPLQWQIGELKFLNKNEQVHLGGPYDFSSAWVSAGSRPGVGLCRPRRPVPIRPHHANLDPPSRRRRAPSLRRCQELDDPARRSTPPTSNSLSPPPPGMSAYS